MKKKVYAKLVCAALVLLSAMAMIVMGSYSWFTLSTSPAVEGIQVAVGGGSTILLAPDLVDKNGVHYPGAFSGTLRLDELLDTKQYSGLTPVSTADGLNWYLPVYYTENDPEVQAGPAKAGDLKPYNQFLCDTTLTYANLLADDESAAKGSYLYVDFWVVSPGSRYELRVSTSDEASGAGSYAADLPMVTESEDGILAVTYPQQPASESLRVGFLVNQNAALDSEDAYKESSDFDRRYTVLMGGYQEKGKPTSAQYSYNRFHIYEPNGSSHSALKDHIRDYIITFPLGQNNGVVQGVSVGDSLSVQMKSSWAENMVNDRFTAACKGESSAPAVQARLRKDLAGRSDYVNKGKFVKNTETLYAKAEEDHTVPGDILEQMDKAGANESNSIATLERNVPQRIRMFIWLEGQDADCVSGASVSGFAMRIELAGSTIK